GRYTRSQIQSAVGKNALQLGQMYELLVDMAWTHNKIFTSDILTRHIRLVEVTEKIVLRKECKLMARQAGSEIYLIPSDQVFNVPGGYIQTNSKDSTMLTISDDSPPIVALNDINQYYDLPLAINEKNCTNYSSKNEAALNISIGQ